MSKVSQKIERIRGKRGGSADFLKVSRTNKYTLRLYRYVGSDGELEMFHDFEQHRISPKETLVCRKFLDGPSAHCEPCDTVKILYDEDTKQSKEQAGKMRAKARVWFAAFDMDGKAGGSQEKFGIVEFSGYGGEQILHKVAMVGGWMGDWSPDDEECLACLEKGIDQCFGPDGRDLMIDANDKRKPMDYYRFAFSQRKGKKLPHKETDTPKLPDIWYRVKAKQEGWEGADDGGEEEPVKKTRGTPSVKSKKSATKRKAAAKKKKKK